MVDVSVELGRLSDLDELSGQAVEGVLGAAGWTGERRNPAKARATTWRRDGASAWVQGNAPVEVQFTLWHRGVEDEHADPDTYLEELYEAAVAELPTVVSQLTSGVLGPRLQESDRDLTDGEDYIDHRAWLVADKVVLAGVKHSDTDAPVQNVVVLRQDTPDADDEDYEDDDWS
ncbi:hypothetical protein ABZ770_35295 [Streptomyces sp. NPDC006654]|uniref:hypothetical protein n=1 Tax=Streptomyces sp. NPDC006654 TaxID=3156897 RepID=UPI0033C779C5